MARSDRITAGARGARHGAVNTREEREAGSLRRATAAVIAIAAALAACASSVPAQAGPKLTGSTTQEACHTWASGRSLTGVNGYIGAAGWIMVFDDTAPPADGAVTATDAGGDWVQSYYVPQSGSWSLWFGSTTASTAQFTNGIVVCASSTGPFQKTSYSTATFRAQVQ